MARMISNAHDAVSKEEAIREAGRRMGYDNVKDEQLEVIMNFLQGRDTFVCLPTGSGKSFCYQALPHVFDLLYGLSTSFALVVSPLTALIEDQISILRTRNTSAASMTNNQQSKLSSIFEENKIVFTSPEILLRDEEWRDILLCDVFQKNIIAFIVDEAHCVKKW